MSPAVKLVYFPLRARAELIRLALEAGGIDYEEEVIKFEEWPDRKPDMPYNSLPVLYWDGEELGQSLAIARFVAKQANLAGDDDVSIAKVDAVLDHVAEVANASFQIRFCPDEDEKQRKKEEFRDKTFPQFLNTSERLLRTSGGDYFCGNSLTLADLCMFHCLDLFASAKSMGEAFGDIHEDLLKSMAACNGLTQLHRHVKAVPRIAHYLKNRPDYPF